jgi:hypothetical protein
MLFVFILLWDLKVEQSETSFTSSNEREEEEEGVMSF